MSLINKKNFFFWLILRSIFSVFYINILIVLSRVKNKKIFFFYYPRKLTTRIHTFYIEDLFKNFLSKTTVIYGHEAHHIKLGKNYIYIKEGFLKFILGVDIFMSTSVCDKFITNSKKIYLNHHIYDSPMVNFEKEKYLCKRLSSYDVAFIASKNLIKLYNNMFKRHNYNIKIKMPILKEIGYPKFDFLEKKIKNLSIGNKKKCILISPTNIKADPKFSLMNDLVELIEKLLDGTDFDIIYRPHPSNRYDPKVLIIRDKFSEEKKFYYDISEDYSEVFSKSFCMIADHSDTAYMFSFLTMHPVVFYSNRNLENFIKSNEAKIKFYDYKNLNYFTNRDKIGIIINDLSSISEKIQALSRDCKKYAPLISKFSKEIKYLGRSKERFEEEVESLIFKS
jgi:hypothetical protein